MTARFPLVPLVLVLLLLAQSTVRADTTAITLYDVELGVMREGLVLGRETITLHVADASPTEMARRFDTPPGQDGPPAVEVRTVRLDGLDAPFTMEREANSLILTVPVNDRLISGEHTLYMEYSVEDVVAFGQESDSLAWNVTGDAWFIPILSARALVMLPGAADILDQSAITGTPDNPGKRYFMGFSEEGRPVYETSSPLLPGERLIIELSWPKGVVEEGGNLDMTTILLASLAAAILSALLFVVRRRRPGHTGKD